MSEEKHTPLPWKWDAGIIPPDGPGTYSDIYVTAPGADETIIAQINDQIPEGRGNALLILRSVNAVPALLKALEEIDATLKYSKMAREEAALMVRQIVKDALTGRNPER